MAVITISRGSLGLGAALAEKLAGVLGYPCLGREVARDAADRFGIAPELMAKKVEESPSLWQRMTSERSLYIVAMASLLSERAMGGQLVYHGYAGHLLLQGMPALLRVRVIAPLEARVPLVMKEQQITAEAAEAHIRKMDEARARWARFVFGVDWQDPSNYDLVLNLGVISVDAACEAVAGIARSPELALDERTRDRLRDFALTARVRAELVKSPLTRSWHPELEVKGGIAFLKGSIPDDPRYADWEKRFKAAVSDLILAIDGIKHVTVNDP